MDNKTTPEPQKPGQFTQSRGWTAVCDDNLPPLDEIVWLWDGKRIWLGGLVNGGDRWLWGNTYGCIWRNGVKWEGHLETDDDYSPTHWMPLPDPPNDRAKPNRTNGVNRGDKAMMDAARTELERLRDVVCPEDAKSIDAVLLEISGGPTPI